MQNFIKGIVALFLVMLLGCSQESTVSKPQLRSVRYVTVADLADSRIRTFSGISKSAQESRLSFKVAGTVVEIPVQVGDELKTGGLVARLDPFQYELQLQQSQASLVQAQANARNAKANYERIKGLYENNNASRNDLDSARAAAESAVAQQKSSQKSLELAQLNLSYTRLTVDIDCSIAELTVEVNENVNIGDQVARVNCGHGLEVIFNVPESLIAGISQDMPVDVHFDSLPNRTFKGRVFEVGVSSTGAAATFPVSVKLDQTDEPTLRSGLAVKVSFSFSSPTKKKAFMVPLAAIIKDTDGTFVFIADPSEEHGQARQAIVRRQAVRLGELTERGMEILEGITSGDRVITAGVSVIREGQKVLLP